jgi:hypothetical protein
MTSPAPEGKILLLAALLQKKKHNLKNVIIYVMKQQCSKLIFQLIFHFWEMSHNQTHKVTSEQNMKFSFQN